MTEDYDVTVIGGGLAGATAALALAEQGVATAFVAPPAPQRDGRTTALLKPSIALLDRLGVWPHVADHAAPLKTLRIVDGSRRLFRAPAVSFSAGEIGEDCFGENIANAALMEALDTVVDRTPGLTRYPVAAEAVDVGEPAVITLGDGRRLRTRLIVAADGRNSIARQAAGIATRTWSYPQSAIVLTFTHQRPHENISTEFHTESGPFTQVPLPGDRSSLVWVVSPDESRRIADTEASALNRMIEDRMQSMLGAVSVDSALQTFPLSGMVARSLAKGPVVLVGEAAHVFPPIGAQGLNLGMRDVAELVRHPIALDDRASVTRMAERYGRARYGDVVSRTTGVDLLNRSLLSGFLPVQFARAAGLSMMAAPGPLRAFAIREGMVPGSALKALGERLREQVRR